jgi:tetratricopeptide (TPR) repeat protein
MLLPGLGGLHHPIATSSPEAQKFFDQGLTLVYGFNHEEAVRLFQRAAELDPKAAMPLWGIALALGPNINMDVSPESEKAAYDAVQSALKLSATAPGVERDYIRALAKRYTNDPKADLKQAARDYAAAMKELMGKYPDDLDAATLYADALMNLHPWKLWTADSKPEEGTLEIVSTLEAVLRRDPKHIGANHFYIHAVEASPHPERAKASADRLGGLAPGAGHLVHMPGHIYMLLGDYDTVVRTNEAAAEADRAYMRLTGVQGMYTAMYYSHNLDFLRVAWCAQGQFRDAKKAADEIAANNAPMAVDLPMVQPFLALPWFVLLRFHRWDDMLAVPDPGEKLPIARTLWHFARGVAYAGNTDASKAKAERDRFYVESAAVPADTPWGVNTAAPVLALARAELDARIAEARGDTQGAIVSWRKAVELQDAIPYDEPPDWYYWVRESLGGALLRGSAYAAAEEVFREDLKRHPNNPRSVFGLVESLKRQNKPLPDGLEDQFRQAWRHAEKPLSVEDL